jgi:DNA-binding MarR family transcriptional regulator
MGPALALETFTPYRLNRIAAAMSERLRGVYGRQYDLTVPEWRILATLGQFGEMTAKQIGAHSVMHKTKVSRAVSALATRRWLTRRENAGDRREEFLKLTEAGTSAYAAILPAIARFEADLAVELGRGEARALDRALSRLEAVLAIAPKAAAERPSRGARPSRAARLPHRTKTR